MKGRLIAIEGSTGTTLSAAARSVVRTLREADESSGLSPWDASGIFTDLSVADPEVAAASPWTLTLLYAADLAFRIRWHILPALEAGETVVAAPYVESAKALGIAAGVPRHWLDELFSFAPKPSVSLRIHRARVRERSSARSGYSEWFTRAVTSNGNGLDATGLHLKSTKYLDLIEARHKCRRLTSREVELLKRPRRGPR